MRACTDRTRRARPREAAVSFRTRRRPVLETGERDRARLPSWKRSVRTREERKTDGTVTKNQRILFASNRPNRTEHKTRFAYVRTRYVRQQVGCRVATRNGKSNERTNSTAKSAKTYKYIYITCITSRPRGAFIARNGAINYVRNGSRGVRRRNDTRGRAATVADYVD